MRHLPLCVGDWKRARQPGRELAALRVRRVMYLPDLHRLPTYLCDGTPTTSCAAGIPSLPSYHHGIVLDHHVRAIITTNSCALCIHLLLCRFPDHHAFHHHLPGVPHLRLLRSDANHSGRPGIRGASPLARAQSRRQRRGRQDPGLPQLVQPVDPYCRVHKLANAALLYDIRRGERRGVVGHAGRRFGR